MPKRPTPLRTIVALVVALISSIAVVASIICVSWISAYANWLRFSSPTAPNPTTGQVVHFKGAKAIIYVTTEQAWWIHTMSQRIWIAGFLAALLAYALRPRDDESDSETDFKESKPSSIAIVLERSWIALGAIAFATFITAHWFGDYVMQYYFTGSFELPSDR